MHEKMLLWGHCMSQKCHFGLLIGLFALGYDLSAETGVHAWTYHYNISPNRNWNSAREWCRQHYTDMVAIQNQKEIAYLNKTLPKNKYYYWIGIRKIGGEWTWVGTNKTLTQEAENWAKGEPNNKGQEDCVEIYIKRYQESGKWNDQSCRNKKGTLCYHASCSEESCSTQAECVETIGNYTCKCHPGFQGPRCQEAVTCGILKAPQYGSMQCSHAYGSFQFNSSCTLHCAQGFSLMGAPHLQCQASGHWDADPPLCQAVKCPELSSAPTRRRMKCTHAIGPDSYNSTCEFSCEEGFELNGPSSTWCNSSGSWSDAMPICEARRCDRQTVPPHGSLHCFHPYEGFSFSSSCNVSCEEGFLLNGTASTQCTSLGLWTEPPPHCQAQRCDTLTAPLHGSLHCFHPHEEFSFSSSCNVSCEEGFLLNGTASTLCTSLGVWTEPPPLCQARRCDVLTAPIHGSLHCSHPHKEFSFNSTCNMSCVEGFLLNGAASTQCTSMGVWTEPPPLCLARRCDTLTAPLHGFLHCSHPHEEFSFSSSCNVSCVEGFLLNGTDSTQCTSLGVWTEPRPLCQAQRCDTLTAPLHGSLHCFHLHEEFSFSSSCNVSCEEGFLLNGAASPQCTSLGVWTEPPPLCQARGCNVLTAPLHGSLHCSHPHKEFSFNSTCNMSCVEGFLLNGTASTQCTSLGVWTEPPPLCLARRCDTLTAPLHGFLYCSHPHEEFSFSSSCNVSCVEGFLLNGTDSTQCTSLGVWTEPRPLCQARRCDVLTAPLHGSLHCSHPHKEFSFNSTCNMSCVEGFLLNGAASTQCTSLGVWTEPPPLCLARQCLPLVVPGRGQMNCSHPHSNFSFGSSCELGCEEGFVLRGAPTLQCTESGLWSHTVPYCQARQCNKLTAPLHGSLHCFNPHEEFSFSTSCNVSCEEGFLLNGTASTQCASLGVWTESPPLCQVVQCPALSDLLPPFLSMKCSNPLGIFSFRSQCFFHCGNGSSLNGTYKLSCTSNGMWTAPPPSCTEPEMTVGTGMMISTAVGFASAIALLLLGGLGFFIVSHLSKRAARKDYLEARDIAIWEELENPAFEEEH
ncbi:P-selectin-like isoform X1 [Conger conger]|uniref:P-selectin-like isoform X1 n=1 Tax=Conger conger TaxID=82655 RepID=UPI002A59D1E2|nr:P-selectin-like isoform X1 [Conger conger]